MISLYSGTPGSGKSLHVAKTIYWWVRAGKPCICNFPVATEKIKLSRKQDFRFVREDRLTPDYLVDFAQDYIKKKVLYFWLLMNAKGYLMPGTGDKKGVLTGLVSSLCTGILDMILS